MDEISNTNSYDKIALQWTDDRHKYSFVSNLIIKFANKVKAGGTILDVGCGSGVPNAAYLCDKGFSLKGIDVSEKMIQIAREQKISHALFEVSEMFDINLLTPLMAFLPGTHSFICLINSKM